MPKKSQINEHNDEGFGPKNMFSTISHVLVISNFKDLEDVCLGYFKIIPKDIGECVVQCVVWGPFFGWRVVWEQCNVVVGVCIKVVGLCPSFG
jgi:hypothetical protein